MADYNPYDIDAELAAGGARRFDAKERQAAEMRREAQAARDLAAEREAS